MGKILRKEKHKLVNIFQILKFVRKPHIEK